MIVGNDMQGSAEHPPGSRVRRVVGGQNECAGPGDAS